LLLLLYSGDIFNDLHVRSILYTHGVILIEIDRSVYISIYKKFDTIIIHTCMEWDIHFFNGKFLTMLFGGVYAFCMCARLFLREDN